MLRTIIAFVIFTSTINAEPFKKHFETPEAKMKRLYGELKYRHDECSITLGKKDQLVIEQTRYHQLYSCYGYNRIPPFCEKSVTGNFIITIHCKPRISAEAKYNMQAMPFQSNFASCYGGLSLYCENFDLTFTTSLSTNNDKHTTGYSWMCPQAGGTSTFGDKHYVSGSYLRITRKGNKFIGETSVDGKKFTLFGQCEVKTIQDTIHVGPMIFHNTDSTCSVIFDDYTINKTDKKQPK